jgi:hypothetical protein
VALTAAEALRRRLARRLGAVLPGAAGQRVVGRWRRRSSPRSPPASRRRRSSAPASRSFRPSRRPWPWWQPSRAWRSRRRRSSSSSSCVGFASPRTCRRSAPSRASLLQSAGLDLVGWSGGCAIAWAATRGGEGLGVLLLVLCALLAGEAARNGLQLAENSRRLGELLKANREAVRGIDAGHPQRGGIAEQVRFEGRTILAFTWFSSSCFRPTAAQRLVGRADSGLEGRAGAERRRRCRDSPSPRLAPGRPAAGRRGRAGRQAALWCDPVCSIRPRSSCSTPSCRRWRRRSNALLDREARAIR